ncbi:deoxyguanosinetriphosphate triphosphohydrolase [Eubacteriales bacterium OttesenSCG-928-M02]|nr:deoxyguanosinetriphosphate triphosphohydrolase [Eubacteriales bacterium OttesenSCG-928-M02]
MTPRERTEQNERRILSPYATFADSTKGRERKEEPCPIRTAFQRDRDRIVHSKAFRRLKDKTQVFISAEDHYRVRLTHTMEVMQIARTIARALGLNEDLTEAIALGHDLGHTPFSHAGEATLNKIADCGFHHNAQSVRVVKYLEREGKGLNLTYEVLDGMENHRTENNPQTPEGQVVRLSDKIAYINHDVDDALRRGDLTETDLPKECTDILGHDVSSRINTMIHNVLDFSADGVVAMAGEVEKTTGQLRQFLFERVYRTPDKLEKEVRVDRLITALFEYYMENPGSMPVEYEALCERFGRDRGVCDYIAGMTDHFAVETFTNIFVP